jgi:Fic family protein
MLGRFYLKLESLKEKLEGYRPLSPQLMQAIDKKIKIEWTYNSNAIEGNTLTLQETSYFLQHGLTSKGRTLKEYFEAQNHAEAIDWLKDIIKNDRRITEGLIKQLHALLMKGIDYIWVGPDDNRIKKDMEPGKYKTQPNHVITINGDIHKYCEPVKVLEEMEKLIDFINKSDMHPVEIAARAHHKLVEIHPFNDGNGRVARLLMNLILMRNRYVPVIIKCKKREEYYRALMKADKGNISDFTNLVSEEEKNNLELIIDIIRKY